MDKTRYSGKLLLIYLILIFAFLGVLDAGYLTHNHYAGESVSCSLTGGCDIVLGSSYATALGVPVALIGTIYYLVIFLLALRFLKVRQNQFFTVIFWLSVLAFAVAMYLIFIQFFVLNHLCLYCLASEALSAGILICSLFLCRGLVEENLA